MEIKKEAITSSSPTKTQVIIVGGGPVGLSAAIELGLRGIKCVVVEPRKEISKLRPRAKTVSVRSMEHLRRWGIADKIREAAPLPVEWSQTISFCNHLLGNEITRMDEVLGLSVKPQEDFSESSQQIPQFTVEEVLRQSVSEIPEIQFLKGWKMEKLDQDEGKVVAHLIDDNNRNVSIEGEYLLGCDGARSKVRHEIGVVFEGESDSSTNFNVLFKSPKLAQKISHAPAIQYWILNEEFPGFLGRLNLKDLWWMIAIGVGEEEGNSDPEHFIHGLIGEDIPVEVISTDVWSARMLLANRYRSGRVFLVGDAAHQNPPFGGHGFNTGLGDAVDIGWKLAAVLQGWGGFTLLDSYEEERRPISAQVIKVAQENMRMKPSNLTTNPEDKGNDDSFASSIQETKKMEFHSLGIVLGYRYDQSPIVIDDATEWPPEDVITYHPTSHPGARLPHTWVSKGISIYDELGPGFTLLRLDSEINIATLVKEVEGKNIPFKVVTINNPELLNKYEKPLILVRPDQHVAWRGDKIPNNPSQLIDKVRGVI